MTSSASQRIRSRVRRLDVGRSRFILPHFGVSVTTVWRQGLQGARQKRGVGAQIMSDPLAVTLLVVAMMVLVVWSSVREYRNSPMCHWCRTRHRGRCIYNPRSGRMFANTNDGHFDYDDPNK